MGKNLISFVIIIGLIFVMGWAAKSGLAKDEKNDCLKWQRLSHELRPGLFYLTPWQKEQCDYWGVKIDVLVKGGSR